MQPGNPTIERRAAGTPRAGVARSRIAELAGQFGPWLGGAALPFVLVVYLALKGGGYDAAVRSEVGIAIWWIVLLGALAGILPMARPNRGAWLALGLLVAFATWTAYSISWSESPGRSFDEVARVAVYVGALALAISVQGPAGLRRMVGAVGWAIALVGLLAVLSRLQPSWFPTDEAAALPNAQGRLNYPLNYWNGLAALMALGLFPLLSLAVGARHLVVRSIAIATLPVIALTTFYTTSRSAIPIAIVGLVVFLIVHPRHLRAAATIALGALGGALAIIAAAQRNALELNLGDATAARQGDEMLGILLIVCVGVGLLGAALGLAVRHGIGPRITIPRDHARRALAGLAALAIAIAIAGAALGEADKVWEQFKGAGSPSGGTERLASASGNGRYQYWSATIDQNASAPVRGTGAGTFELWWEQHADLAGPVRYAHSLYFETLGELGIVGLALLIGAVIAVLAAIAYRARKAAAETRGLLAGALAAWVAFALAMGVDWSWQLAVMPVAALLLAGAALTGVTAEAAGAPVAARGRRAITPRIVLAVLAAVALAVITDELLAKRHIEDSQAAARQVDLDVALSEAEAAEELQPWAAEPRLQQALVLEQMNRLPEATNAALEAAEREPGSWEPWFTLARISRKDGRYGDHASYLESAQQRNPTYEAFQK